MLRAAKCVHYLNKLKLPNESYSQPHVLCQGVIFIKCEIAPEGQFNLQLLKIFRQSRTVISGRWCPNVNFARNAICEMRCGRMSRGGKGDKGRKKREVYLLRVYCY